MCVLIICHRGWGSLSLSADLSNITTLRCQAMVDLSQVCLTIGFSLLGAKQVNMEKQCIDHFQSM